MPNRKPFRPQKTSVFLGCEGKSEVGYARWLNRLAGNSDQPCFIISADLYGGDPLAMVQEAVEKIENRRVPKFGECDLRGLILDTNYGKKNRERDARAIVLAVEHDIQLIWQSPTHEGFLVKHFVGGQDLSPATGKLALQELKKYWPNYVKGMDAIAYGLVLGPAHLMRIRAAHPEFHRFLLDMGWK